MTFLALLALLPSPARAGSLDPRAPLPPQELVAAPLAAPPAKEGLAAARLTVKLRDHVGARADGQGGLRSSQQVDLAALDDLRRAHGLHFRPLLDLAPARLAALRDRARDRSGRDQPDLQAMFIVDLSGGDLHSDLRSDAVAEQLVEVGAALQQLSVVEYAWIEHLGTPPPEDLGSPTADWSDQQDYLEQDAGIGARALMLDGYRGARVRLADCEYGWEADHEDLVDRDLQLEAGQTVHHLIAEYGYDMHGTACVGQVAAVDNGYGMTGGAPDVEVATYPEYTEEVGGRRAEAIASAIADSAAGDVVMLEMQTSLAGDSRYGPAELDPNVWTIVRAGVDAGVIVVGAAGNGSQDLDHPNYDEYNARGDSGAILVGAGSADALHAPLSYSTYGTRIDLQGWGEQVYTLSYGDLATVDGDPRQRYTARFSGTSSATPVVATAVVLLQDVVLDRFGTPLAPDAMRALLVETGVPQSPGHQIGPLPDLLAAVDALDLDLDGELSGRWGGPDADDDGDGHDSALLGGDDCDDTDAAVHPGAEEIINNGIDDDCDKSTSDDPPVGDTGDTGLSDSGTGDTGDGGSADSGTGDSGDAGSGDGGDDDGGDDDDDDDDRGRGCCASAGGPRQGLLAAAGLLVLVGLRRRRGQPVSQRILATAGSPEPPRSG